MQKLLNDLQAPNCAAAAAKVMDNGRVILDMPEFKTLEYLEGLAIKDLTIIGKLTKDSAQHLATLSGLESFALIQPHLDMRTLTYIETMTNLTELDISGNPIVDFSPLTNLKKLKSLRADARLLTQPQVLFKLRQLEDLTLHGGAFKSFAFVLKLPNLRSLSLFQTHSIESKALSHLSHATSLTSFDASTTGSNKQLDLNTLTSSYLRTLLLNGFKVTNVSRLQTPNLVGLSLVNADISEPSSLPRLKYLRRLNLSENPVTKLPDFKRFPALETLIIQRSNIHRIQTQHVPKHVKELALDLNPICKHKLPRNSVITSCVYSKALDHKRPTAKTTKARRDRPRHSTPGEYTSDQVVKTLKPQLNKIRGCYTEFLEKQPRSEGNMRMSWLIQQDGSVKDVKLLSTTIENSAPLAVCIVQTLTTLKFPSHSLKAPPTITYPFKFVVPSED